MAITTKWAVHLTWLFSCLSVMPAVVSALEIGSIQKVAVLSEKTNVNTVLSKVNCTDGGGPVAVDILSVIPNSPCGGCFDILTCGDEKCIEYRAGLGTLSYSSAPFYAMKVSCRNNVDKPVTDIVHVIIKPNQPPYFVPHILHETETNRRSPINIGKGTSLYQVSAKDDDDSDTVRYYLTTHPSEFDSMFDIGEGDGIIKNTVHMRHFCGKELTFEVTICDGTATVGPKVISYSLPNSPNVRPIVTNLNDEIHIPEDATGRFFTLAYADGNPFATSYTYTSSNPAGLAQYDIDGKSLKMKIAKPLNFEDPSLRVTDVEIQVSDGYCKSDLHNLKIVVKDVNEPPVISPKIIDNFQVCEGTEKFNPGLKVTDEDEVDTQRWTLHRKMGNSNGYYNIEALTGIFTVIPDYDVDNGVHPPRHTYIVQVEDKGGLTATGTVSVTFLDCNDNAPVFNRPAYTFTTTECATGGTRLGSVRASDQDSSREDNNVITYSGGSGSVLVDASGQVNLVSPRRAGTVIYMDAVAKDKGKTPGPLTSVSPAKVTVVFTKCPPPPPPPPVTPVKTAAPKPTTRAISLSNTASGDAELPWIILASILGAIFLGLLSFMCWKYGNLLRCPSFGGSRGCRNSFPCTRKRKFKPRRVEHRGPIQKSPLTPPPEEPAGPGFIFGFWKERYPDNNFSKQPNRRAIPEAGDIEPVYPHTIDPVVEPQLEVPAQPKKPQGKSCIIQ